MELLSLASQFLKVPVRPAVYLLLVVLFEESTSRLQKVVLLLPLGNRIFDHLALCSQSHLHTGYCHNLNERKQFKFVSNTERDQKDNLSKTSRKCMI